MKIEIWSDVVCPFCYIGKRKFETALASFHGRGKVEVEWKSFQLDPSAASGEGSSVIEYLAERKGISIEQAEQMHEHVRSAAEEVGLDFRFDKAVVANTHLAHQLIHFAKKHGKQHEAEERLFAAYFLEGKDIGNVKTLTGLAKEINLDPGEAEEILINNSLEKEVDRDILEAQQLGIRGVPFFVFNRKYAISGAQGSEAFTEVLNKTLAEESPLNIINGDSCDINGNC